MAQIPFRDFSILNQSINVKGGADQASLYPARLKISQKLDEIRRGQQTFNTVTGIIAGGIDVAASAYKLASSVNLMKGQREVELTARGLQTRTQAAWENGEIKWETYDAVDPDTGQTVKASRPVLPEDISKGYQDAQASLKEKYSFTPEVAASLEGSLRDAYYQVEQKAMDISYAGLQKERQAQVAANVAEWKSSVARGDMTSEDMEARIRADTSYLTAGAQDILVSQANRDAGYEKLTIDAFTTARKEGLDKGYEAIDSSDYSDEEKRSARANLFQDFAQKEKAATEQAVAAFRERMDKDTGASAGDVVAELLKGTDQGFRDSMKDVLYKAQAERATAMAWDYYAEGIEAGYSEAGSAGRVVARLRDSKGGLGLQYYGPDGSLPQKQRGSDILTFMRMVPQADAGSAAAAVENQARSMITAYIEGGTFDGKPMTYGQVYSYMQANASVGEISNIMYSFSKEWSHKLPPKAMAYYDGFVAQAKKAAGYDNDEWKTLMLDTMGWAVNWWKDAPPEAKTKDAFESVMKDSLAAAVALGIRDKEKEGTLGAMSMGKFAAGVSMFAAKGEQKTLTQYYGEIASGRYDPVMTDPATGTMGFYSDVDEAKLNVVAEVLGTNVASFVGSSPTARAYKDGPKRFSMYFEPRAGGEDVTARMIFKDEATKAEYKYEPTSSGGLQLFTRASRDAAWAPTKSTVTSEDAMAKMSGWASSMGSGPFEATFGAALYERLSGKK